MKKVLILLLGAIIISTGLAFAGDKAHWGYSGEEGPEHWGEFSAICKSGKNQSPINLTGMIDARQKPLVVDYQAVPLDAVNNGHTIQVNYAEGSTLRIDGKTFNLLQFHFHSPSENNIRNESFPMEAHLVHADEEGNLAVIAVMFVKGGANPLLKKVWEQMPAKSGEKVAMSDVVIDINDMLPRKKNYYRFNGSLTTPPCTEGVRWFVLKTAMYASADQIGKFHTTLHGDTNRPIQPTNARPVLN